MAGAVSVCKKGLERHPRNTNGRVVLGRVFHQQGKNSEAAGELKKALEIDPENLMALSLLGAISMAKNDFQAAIEEFQKILALNPDDEDAQKSLKTAIEKAASHRSTETPAKKDTVAVVVKGDAKGSTATLTMAELYLKQGHLDDAIDVYQELLAADPQNLMLRQKLADIVERRKQGNEVPKELTASQSGKKHEIVKPAEKNEQSPAPKVSPEDDSKFTNEDILQVMRRGGKDDVVLEEVRSKPPKTATPIQKEVAVKNDPAPSAAKEISPEKVEQLKGILAELNAVSGIMRCFLIGKDGIIVVSMGESSNNADLGKQALAIFDNTRRSVTRLDQGKLHQIFVTAESGNILLVSFENHVLTVLANNKINLGLLRLSLDSAVKKLDTLSV